jgi:hypothetical protein
MKAAPPTKTTPKIASSSNQGVEAALRGELLYVPTGEGFEVGNGGVGEEREVGGVATIEGTAGGGGV